MIFEALQSDIFRFKFHLLGSKILKIPEFNLTITNHYLSKIMVISNSGEDVKGLGSLRVREFKGKGV